MKDPFNNREHGKACKRGPGAAYRIDFTGEFVVIVKGVEGVCGVCCEVTPPRYRDAVVKAINAAARRKK